MAEGNVREQVGEVISKAKRRVGAEKPSAADSDGNVGIVRGALRAFGEGDMDGFLDALTESVEWEAPEGKHFPGGGSQSGRDAVKSGFVGDAGRTYSSFGFRPESFFDADDDDAVVVLGRFVGEGVEGGSVDSPGVQVWEFEGNSAARILIVADSASFPKVVTEKDEQEKERKKEEEEKGEDEQAESKGERSEEQQPKDSESGGEDKASESKSEQSEEQQPKDSQKESESKSEQSQEQPKDSESGGEDRKAEQDGDQPDGKQSDTEGSEEEGQRKREKS